MLHGSSRLLKWSLFLMATERGINPAAEEKENLCAEATAAGAASELYSVFRVITVIICPALFVCLFVIVLFTQR